MANSNMNAQVDYQVVVEEKSQKKVTSQDGTLISFEQIGQGPTLIMVAAALSDRSDTTRLAEALADSFTVINHDRRGRGESGDTAPYSVEREIEDIEALIDKAGGPAYLFGSSSGAVLALEAASRLGNKVKRLFMYEPPLIVDDSRPPMPDGFAEQIERLLDAGRNSDAVKLFFNKGMGIPAIFVTLMKFMPGWSKMTAMAHTLLYDLAITKDIQAGKPLPVGRWVTATMPALVMAGEKSEPFFQKGAQALANHLPNAQYRVLKGQSHGAIVTGAKTLAPILKEFFQA
jgi:pimeloyl-ACP methyl ester carboxylesterase